MLEHPPYRLVSSVSQRIAKLSPHKPYSKNVIRTIKVSRYQNNVVNGYK